MPVQFKATGDNEPRTVQFKATGANGPSGLKSSRFRSIEENSMAVLLKCFLFFQSITNHGMGAFVNVYLVVINGWSPLMAAWVWFTKDIICLCCQTFFGAYVDQTKNKKLLLFVLAATMIGSGVILTTSTNFGLLIFQGVLDGIHKTMLLPVVTAMTLGSVGKTRFHRKHAAVNSMISTVATGVGSLLIGGIGYAIYPDIQKVFSLLIAVGIGSILCILAMPKEGDAVNRDVARGSSIVLNVSIFLTNLLVEDDDDADSDDEFGEEPAASKEPTATRTDDPKGAEEADMRQRVRDGRTSEVKITSVMSLQEMFADPSRRTSLIFLFLVFFSFHLVNATTLPLLGQYLGKRDKPRDALPIMTGLYLVASAGSFCMTWFLKGNLRKVNYRTVLLIGCGALTLRLILITILVNFTTNLWAIGCTNILDGIGVGSLDLMLALYSHLLSRQTGHYNLNMAVIGTAKEIGSALSVVLGGALAEQLSYETAFLVLTVMMILPILFSFGVSTPSLYGEVKKQDPVLEDDKWEDDKK
mmetsp:Transcript_6622/g.9698  ORF Transcript_6622/g.9698 Transcript_6622/m.9698 type:complete len:528 (+) Transcript_6622:365-1948(+)|eukprot:CAMPEP_0194109044 /NCGR_PEP_ID=MMETSP0150-20130528/8644_1 /TAXON_ID=122233 /ORGANISM="Chaetoceros debilis, Strain MM31A-1" /LENGTH=527 /DNA_ID=CAMNT_0038797913 /DNA_START=338 /DNA_END=1921 /DNA_ORIENTATION=+